MTQHWSCVCALPDCPRQGTGANKGGPVCVCVLHVLVHDQLCWHACAEPNQLCSQARLVEDYSGL